MIWFQALRWPGIALAIAATLSWLVSVQTAAWWLAAVLAGYALWQTLRLARLHHWAALPRQRELPMGAGAWDVLFERIGRYVNLENETRAELSAELAQLHAAVDQLPDGLTLIDRLDHVEWCNNAAAELHGIFASGRPVHHFIRQPEFVDYLDSSGYRSAPVIALPSRPGRFFELRLHPVDDGGKLLITRDVTDQARLDAMRRDFVANVSHEIRTPVTVIGGFAETLLSIEVDEDSRREYLSTILKQSQTMQRLVDDLLTLSTLENSGGPDTEEQIDIRAMVEAIAAEAQALSQGGHTIEIRIDDKPTVLASAIELESAIRNLMTNAVRYTPVGGRIVVQWRDRDGRGELQVRDTGIGIAAEHLPRLTERFYRVDRSRSRGSGGTGLGLAIVKHIMNRHGGDLSIESHVGEGSAFTLRFPGRRLIGATPSGADGNESPVPAHPDTDDGDSPGSIRA
jgi:two-component system phosphate regulon sensor histidine kinase PhoR